MKALVQGQNTALAGTAFTVKVACSGGAAASQIDVSAFMLESSGKVSGDEDMVFYGQTASRDGSVSIASESASGGGNEVQFAVDLSIVSGSVERIAFTATTPAASSPPLSTIDALEITVSPQSGDACTFAIDAKTSTEAAMILGELYRRADEWKFRAVGQGFEGGLAPLAEHFGVEVDDAGTAAPTDSVTTPAPAPTAAPATAPAAAPAAATVNLDKISLSKSKPSVSLEKRGASLGEIRVNLNWNQRKVVTKGLFGMQKEKSIDLDLSCLFTLADGGKGAVQALGHNFGAYDQAPWIHLQGDDRTGAVTDGEWLKINGAQWSKIQKVVIFALIYEGVPNWASTDGVVSLYVPEHPTVESKMDGESNMRVCAVATLENEAGSLKMTQENRYFKSAKELDEYYGIGLSWTAGRK